MTSPAELIAVPAEADRLGEAFAAAGHELHLVGGTVRDALLGRRSPDEPDTDLDFATDARPEQVLDLVARVAQATWTTGIEFGTVGARVADRACEITTYRADRYDRVTRKPEVVYGTSLRDDLLRRDFTMNAMALSRHRTTGSSATRSAASPTWPAGCCARLRRRRTPSPTTRCGCCVPPGSSPPSALPSRDDVRGAMTAMAPELGRISVPSGYRSS